MADMLARNWWSLALRGVLAIIFGILAWVWPEVTLTSLVLLFGAYLLVDGVVNIVAAARGRTAEPRWFPVVMGIAEIIIGLVTLLLPGVTAMALVFLIAAWAVTMGAFAIIAAISLRRDIDGEWLLALYGILSILFGLAIAIFPGAGAIALIWLIGTFAVVDGILLLSLAFRLRNWAPLGRDVRTAESTNTAAAAYGELTMMADVGDASPSSASASELPPEIAYGYAWLHEVLLRATGLDLDETQVAFTTRVAEHKLTDLVDVAEEVALANGRERILRHDLPLTKGLRRTIQQTATLTKDQEVDPAAVFKTWVAPNMMVDELLRAELPRLTTALLVLTGQIVATLESTDRPGSERDRLLVRTAPDRPSPWELERAERVLALTL